MVSKIGKKLNIEINNRSLGCRMLDFWPLLKLSESLAVFNEIIVNNIKLQPNIQTIVRFIDNIEQFYKHTIFLGIFLERMSSSFLF